MESEKIIIRPRYKTEDSPYDVFFHFSSLAKHLDVCINILKDEYISNWRCKLPNSDYIPHCGGRMEYIKDEYP